MPRMSKKLKKELAFFLNDGAQKLQRTLPDKGNPGLQRDFVYPFLYHGIGGDTLPKPPDLQAFF